jgi:hypothetical protein
MKKIILAVALAVAVMGGGAAFIAFGGPTAVADGCGVRC